MDSKIMLYHTLFGLILTLIAVGCTPALSSRGDYVAAYHSGDFVQADQIISCTLQKQMPCSDYRKSKEAIWLLLDRATTRFVMGNTSGAIDDYRIAIEAIDYYTQYCPGEMLGQVALQDDCGAYCGEDFEQVLARVYFALALLQSGDDNNALALLKQAEDVQQRKREMYSKISMTSKYQLIDNSLAKYLLAALSEHNGDTSNANILYKQTEKLTNISYDSPHSNSDNATILVLCHNGNVPYKITDYSDASVASAAALEIFQCTQNIPPAVSTLTGIPVPLLMQSVKGEPTPSTAVLDCNQKPLVTLYDVGATAYYQLNQKMPVIVARGAARLLMRRAAVGYGYDRDCNVGALIDLGMLLANSATKADTRSWSTLPCTIDLARFDVAPGAHTFKLIVDSQPTEEYTLRLKPRGFCVINVFNIHPCVTRVLIPNNQGDSL